MDRNMIFALLFVIVWVISEIAYYLLVIKRKRIEGTITIEKDSDMVNIHIPADLQTLYEQKDVVLLKIIRK